MGNTVQECEDLQKRVKVLQSELEKLQNELNIQARTDSISSPESITSQEVNQPAIVVSSWSNSKTFMFSNGHQLINDDANNFKKVSLKKLKIKVILLIAAVESSFSFFTQ